MIETELPTGIPIRNGERSFNEIHQRFSETIYGHVLSSRIRFETFKPVDVSNEKWIGLLGPDVSNLDHLYYTLNLTRSFIRVSDDYFTPEEQRLLLLTSVVHDWGEAVIGDIALPDKTKEHEKKEREALRKIIDDFFLDDINKEDRLKNANEVIGVLSDSTSKLGSVFKAIEELGYVKTALNAWNNISKNANYNLQTSLRVMAHQVTTYHIPALVENAKLYPLVLNFLHDNMLDITKIIYESDDLDTTLNTKSDISRAKQAWFDDFQVE